MRHVGRWSWRQVSAESTYDEFYLNRIKKIMLVVIRMLLSMLNTYLYHDSLELRR